MRPPIGIAVLGFFALVNGIGAAITGLRLMGVVTFGPAETGSSLFFWGLIALGLGVLWIAVAYGAWNVQLWAWTVGMLVAALGILNAVLILFATANVATGLAAALLPGIILWYLNSQGVKEAFAQGDAAGGYAGSYDAEQAQRMAAERADPSNR